MSEPIIEVDVPNGAFLDVSNSTFLDVPYGISRGALLGASSKY